MIRDIDANILNVLRRIGGAKGWGPKLAADHLHDAQAHLDDAVTHLEEIKVNRKIK